MSTQKHKKTAPKKTRIGIITVSTTRTIANDKSGVWISKQAKKEGHTVIFHQVIPDESAAITKTVLDLINNYKPDVIQLGNSWVSILTSIGYLQNITDMINNKNF